MRDKPWWLWILLLLGIGVVRAHLHMLRLLILAAVGLAGLYMLHLVAQDFQKIRQQFNRNGGIQRFTSILRSSGIGKRSTTDIMLEMAFTIRDA
uniref:Uncharacterized protein n=1 Tax=Rhodnius prolixus TaxID=13249 RepID=T1HW42_RHOPR